MIPQTLVSDVLAAIATVMYALGTNLQRRSAARAPRGDGSALRLLARMLHTPRWLMGATCSAAALVLQMCALVEGSVIVVQAIVTCGLVVSLLIESVLDRRPIRARAMVGPLVLVTGVTVLAAVGRPSDGQEPSPGRLILALLAVAVVGGAGALAVRTRVDGPMLARLIGVVSGVCFAIDATFLKQVGLVLGQGHGRPLALAGAVGGFASASMLGNVLIQRAFQMAPLRTVLPAVTAVEPVAALACGMLVFRERLVGTPSIVGVVTGLVIIAAGGLVETRFLSPSGRLGVRLAAATARGSAHRGR